MSAYVDGVENEQVVSDLELEQWPVGERPFDQPDNIQGAAESAVVTRHPEVGLPAVAALRRLTESLETLHVANARELGWSWRQIADSLGVSKQTVHRKYKNKDLKGIANV